MMIIDEAIEGGEMEEFERDTGVPIGWLIEKSEEVCLCASRLVDKVKQLAISETDREHLFVELHPLLYDLTKIVAYVYDGTKGWDANTAQRILDQGTEGFKIFMARVREFSERNGPLRRDQMIGGRMDEPI